MSLEEYLSYTNAEWDQMHRLKAAVAHHMRIIATKLTADHAGQWVAVDLIDGEYEVAPTQREAYRLLKQRRPAGIIHTDRVPPDFRPPPFRHHP